jgi:hypothetical protein
MFLMVRGRSGGDKASHKHSVLVHVAFGDMLFPKVGPIAGAEKYAPQQRVWLGNSQMGAELGPIANLQKRQEVRLVLLGDLLPSLSLQVNSTVS